LRAGGLEGEQGLLGGVVSAAGAIDAPLELGEDAGIGVIDFAEDERVVWPGDFVEDDGVELALGEA
jgi:hypothetical protein